MKTIKIFLASSEELDYDRLAFGNLIRKLDKIYEKRGIRIELFEWEDYDAAFNGVRKQDEYNENIRNSDMFLALFYKKAGKFTVEEFNVATEEFKKHASPKVYTYCKDLQPGEEESPELKEFKKRLFEELGHYWCRYDNNDTMQLHFVMQLQLVENSQSDALQVENGEVTLDGHHIASMDKLKFAAANEDYVRMNERLASLSKDIEGLRMTLLQLPDNEFLNNSLQEKLNEYNKLKEEFAEYQKLLFDTAKRVTQLQGERITERMRRAMDAFSEGKVREANIILDEAEVDAQRNLEDYRQSKEITEQKRQTVINSIEELLLKTSTVMADASIPIEERIERTEMIYAQADEMAGETEYDTEKYIMLLSDYGDFFSKYGRYDEAMKVYFRLKVMSEGQYGVEHVEMCKLYLRIGLAYYHQSFCDKALDCYFKALDICEKICGKENPIMAMSYNNIGLAYHTQGNYSQAREYYIKALNIRERTLGKDHSDTGISYNNLGLLYSYQGDYAKALECYFKALDIMENKIGKEHPDTAASYNNIGLVYYCQGDYAKAMEYYLMALNVWEKVLGKEHPNTASVLGNIGAVYYSQRDYPKALEYYFRALNMREKILDKEHPDTAMSYDNIGGVFYDQGDYLKAMEYHLKALSIRENVLDKEHPSMAASYNNIGDTHWHFGDYQQAISCFLKAYEIRQRVFGKNDVRTASSLMKLCEAHKQTQHYEQELKYRLIFLDYCISTYGESHQETAISYNNVGASYRELSQYNKAVEYIGKAMGIATSIEDTNLIGILHNRLGRVCALMGDKNAAREHFQQAIDLLPENHKEALDSKERMKTL